MYSAKAHLASFVLVVLLASCSSSSQEPLPDAGEDVIDAQENTADADGFADADEGRDGADDLADGAEDAFADDVADAGADGNGMDAGDADPHPCPGPEAYIGDDWPGVLEIPADLCFLAPSIEGRSLEEMHSTQGLMRIAAGTYAVPVAEGTYPLRLPACVQLANAGSPFTLGDVGSVTVTVYGVYPYLSLRQGVYDQTGQEWDLTISMAGEGNNLGVDVASMRGPESSFYYLNPNDFAYYDRWRHTVNFEGGNLTSDFFAAWGGTPSSGVLVGASGNLDGVDFAQTDYWRLVNNHDHHFFGADWAVIFDSPIGSACGLRVDDGNPVGAMPMYDLTVSTIGCDLQPLETRAWNGQDAVEFQLESCPCPGFLP